MKFMLRPDIKDKSEIKTQRCYCGGWVVWKKKSDKRMKQGWKWDLWNCFPYNPLDEATNGKG